MKILVITDENKYSEEVLDTIIRAGRRYPDISLIIAYLSRNITSEGKEKLRSYVEKAKSNGIEAEEDYVTFDFLTNACRYLCTLSKEEEIAAIFVGSPMKEVIELLRDLCPEVDLEVVNIFPVVGEIMTKDVITASQNTTAKDISITMKRHNIGSVIITDNNIPVGIVTESDLVRRVLAEGRDPNTTSAREIMSSPLITADYNMDTSEAASIMGSKKIKKLPVTKDGKLAGIITVSDMAYKFPKIAKSVAKNIHSLHSGICYLD